MRVFYEKFLTSQTTFVRSVPFAHIFLAILGHLPLSLVQLCQGSQLKMLRGSNEDV